MNLVRFLPLELAGLHALVTILVFGAAIKTPERLGLLPLIIFYADYPFSLLLNWLRNILHFGESIRGNLVVDGAVFLIFGSLWFYFIGLLLRTITMKIVDRINVST